jgi:response regulator RpfG family c-di-GMP phosphodiesterase
MEKHKFGIVCVDDDIIISQVLSFQLKKIINKNNTIVECFTSPKDVEANIDELIAFGVELIFVIVDYQMPQLNGAELIRIIKAKHPTVSCIMLSGQANEILVNELKEEELIQEFISKPWNEEELFRVLKPFLKKTLTEQ